MGQRTDRSQSEHDRVVSAWALLLQRGPAKGMQVSTNPGKDQTVRVGPENDPRYPDVVAWRADEAEGQHGAAEIITEVETADSLNEEELAEWAAYGTLPAPFYLVVPAGSEEETIRLLKKNRIRVSQLWTYRIEGQEIMFTQFLTLPGI
jgi:hypothetical protein